MTINERIAAQLTKLVGTMACAWFFAGLALVALPTALGLTWFPDRVLILVTWISQTFIQLVMLSVIMVGQRIHEDNSRDRHTFTHGKLDTLIL